MAADLDDVVMVLKRIESELDHIKNHSAAKKIMEQLASIDSRLRDIEFEVKLLER